MISSVPWHARALLGGGVISSVPWQRRRPYDWALGSGGDGRLPPGADEGAAGMREGGWRRLVRLVLRLRPSLKAPRPKPKPTPNPNANSNPDPNPNPNATPNLNPNPKPSP